jgi:GNAT acetyltransferase-like protein
MRDLGVKTTELKFRLGELTLFAIGRRLQVWQPDNWLDASPFVKAQFALTESIEGALYRSIPIAHELPAWWSDTDTICYVIQQYQRYYVDLSGTYEQYFEKFSSKTKSTLRRKVRKFRDESGGTIVWKEYRSSQELRDFHAIATSLSERTYQARMFDMGLPSDASFLSRMCADGDRDAARGYLLFLNGEAIAYLYCPIQNRLVEYAYVGYLAQYSHLSPGSILFLLVVESLFKEKQHRAFDFTEGAPAAKGSHKEAFSTHGRPCADVVVLKSNWRNVLLVRGHRGFDNFSSGVGAFLDRIGFKSHVKRFMRRFRGA